MKEKELDNLFRNKLEGHKAAPSEDAWHRIDKELRPEKVTWRFYAGIAASLLVIFLISLMIFLPGEDQVIDQLAERSHDKIENNEISEEPRELVAGSELALAEEDEVAVVEQSVIPEEEATVAPDVKREEVTEKQIAQITNTEVENNEVREEQTIRAEQSPGVSLSKINSIADLDAVEGDQNVTLIAQTYEIQVPEGQIEPEQTESDRGLSLRRVVDLAKELKTNTEGWGTLRDAKNELLTFGRKRNEESDD